jgi:hypothetical protein
VKPKVKIIELTPEYVLREYGVTAKQLAAKEKRVAREIRAARKAGTLTEFTGALTPHGSRKKNNANSPADVAESIEQ